MTIADAEKEILNFYPSLEVSTIKLLGSGSDNIAFLINDEWVFRFPQVTSAQADLQKAISLLPQLAQHLSIEIPRFQYIGQENGRVHFVGYRKLRGDPLTKEIFYGLTAPQQSKILETLAGFMQELHTLPLAQANTSGAKEELFKGAYNKGQKYLHKRLGTLLSEKEAESLTTLFDEYEVKPGAFTTRALIHADLKPDHIMYDQVGGEITGIIDWGDACIGDPDYDLTNLYLVYGMDFIKQLLAYLAPENPEIALSKLQFFVVFKWIQDAVIDMERHDTSALAHSLTELRKLIASNFRLEEISQ